MKNKNNKKYLLLFATLFLVIVSFLVGDFVYAANPAANAVAAIVGHLIQFLIWILGGILTVLIYILIWVLQYNDFVNSPAVENGWIIVRDLCNMFFILGLLVIAFATILKLENYSIKKMLPKLIIMAILINFSKMICGLIIDFAQVIMLTFVDGFKEVGGGNLTSILGIKEMLDIDPNVEKDVTMTSIIGSYILALIYTIVSVVVVLVMVAVVVMRMIMLWVYIVLSPLAYLLAAIPGGQKYSSQWWSEFTKNVIVGPVLAFFIWLSFASLGSATAQEILKVDATGDSTAPDEISAGYNAGEDPQPKAGVATAGSPGTMIKFIISIGMLVGGLVVTQQVGATAGGAAGKGMAALQKGQAFAQRGAVGAAKKGMFWTGRKADVGQMKLQQKLGAQTPKSLNYRAIKGGWDAKKAQDMRAYESYGGTHGSAVWQDTFGKYGRIKQYAGWGKSKKKKEEDFKEAEKLEDKNKNLDYQIKLRSASGDKIQSIKDELEENQESIVGQYEAKGLSREEALAQWGRDYTNVGRGGHKELKEERDKNENKIADLKKDRFGWGTAYQPIHSASGSKEVVEKEINEIKQRSDNDYAVISELLSSLENKDSTKTMAALSVLTQNNDLNEALKDDRVRNLMVKQNGILDKLVEQGAIEGNAEEIKEQYRENSVTPAFAQAMVQGMFKEVGVNDKMAARYTNQLGNYSFAGGNGLMYGAAMGDFASGGYDFDKLEMKDGKLEISDNRKAAIVGKFNNLESQTKMRTTHPDTIINEAPDGSASGIHEGGKEFLKSLTTHDLGQINRLRLDVINKIGNSKAAMKDIKNLVKELENNTRPDGSTKNAGELKRDKNQAEMVKYFAGYIKSRTSGSTKGLKEEDAAKKAWDEEIANM